MLFFYVEQCPVDFYHASWPLYEPFSLFMKPEIRCHLILKTTKRNVADQRIITMATAAGASGVSAASDLEMSSPMESVLSDTSRGIESESPKTSRKRNTATGTAISGDFIRVAAGSTGEFHFHRMDKLKSWAKRVTSNKFTTQLMAVVILFDAYCNCGDIDARALGNQTPEIYQVGAATCLVLYTLESSLVLFGQG
eukprot:s292_g15.t1